MLWPIFCFLGVIVCYNKASAGQPGYGYVGPACAVVGGALYVHGVPKRQLTETEIEIFRSYQEDVTKYRGSLLSPDFLAMDAPIVPSFCGGYDDSVEVVLSSCIVRNNHVYINEKLIRGLTNREKQRLETAVARRTLMARGRRRTKRSVGRSAGLYPQRDISTILHRLLNVNSTVTSRFLPVVSQSPLFSMEGALNTMLGKADMDRESFQSQAMQAFSSNPENDNNFHYFSEFSSTTTTAAPTTTIASSTTTTTTTTTTPASTSTSTTTRRPSTKFTKATFKANPNRTKSTKAYQKVTKPPLHLTSEKPIITTQTPNHMMGVQQTYNNSRRRSSASMKSPEVNSITIPKEETVSDPLILQIIAKALANNELLDNFILQPEVPKASVPFLTTGTSAPTVSPLKMKFIVPKKQAETWYAPAEPAVTPSVPFLPPMSYTSLAGNENTIPASPPLEQVAPLPDDICTAHMKRTFVRYL